MRSANERLRVLPHHCGNCIFYECEEDGPAKCLHPHKVDSHDIEKTVEDLAADDGMTAEAIADSLLEDAIADQDWQPYDRVCDCWYSKHGKDREKVLRIAGLDFRDFVKSIIEKKGGKP